MGYIEDIKKINALAKELIQHNIVGSQDEAVVKAREMLVRKNGAATVQNEEYIDLSKAPVQETSKSEEWKEVLAKNNTYIITELKNFRTAMETITKEMQTLHAELNAFKKQQAQNPQQAQQPPREYQTSQQQPSFTVAQNTATQQVTQEAKPVQSHPRAGNYTPADVSVEKFFYFGKK